MLTKETYTTFSVVIWFTTISAVLYGTYLMRTLFDEFALELPYLTKVTMSVGYLVGICGLATLILMLQIFPVRLRGRIPLTAWLSLAVSALLVVLAFAAMLPLIAPWHGLS
jgi:hypothetical protein